MDIIMRNFLEASAPLVQGLYRETFKGVSSVFSLTRFPNTVRCVVWCAPRWCLHGMCPQCRSTLLTASHDAMSCNGNRDGKKNSAGSACLPCLPCLPSFLSFLTLMAANRAEVGR